MQIVADSVITELLSIYHRQAEEESSDKRDLKILVDSVTEQIIQNLFHKKPNGILAARQAINKGRDRLKRPPDRIVADALNSVLKEYGSVFSKEYTESETRIIGFLANHLTHLGRALAVHPSLRNKREAALLRGALK